jgi:hypothetical protein
MLLRAGRKPNSPFQIPKYMDSVASYSNEHHRKEYGIKRVRLFRFVRDHPNGSYLLLTNKHATACINGVVYDDHPLSPYIYVYNSWKYIKRTT